MTNGFLGTLHLIITNLDLSSQRRKYMIYMFAETELIYYTHNVMKVMYACICMCVYICIYAYSCTYAYKSWDLQFSHNSLNYRS